MVAHLDLKSLIEILKINMKTEKEIWIDSYYFPEKYEVSDFGNVRNKNTGILIKSSHDGRGYLKITLGSKSKRITTRVHRLLYLSFNPKTPISIHIHHIDHNKMNNKLNNLDPIDLKTHSSIHAKMRVRLGTLNLIPPPQKGINNHSCKGFIIALCPKTFEIKYKVAGTSQMKDLGFRCSSVYEAIKIPTKKYKGFLFRRPSNNSKLEIGQIFDINSECLK